MTYPILVTTQLILNLMEKKHKLHNVLYAPDLKRNLLSGHQTDKHGYKYIDEAGMM